MMLAKCLTPAQNARGSHASHWCCLQTTGATACPWAWSATLPFGALHGASPSPECLAAIRGIKGPKQMVEKPSVYHPCTAVCSRPCLRSSVFVFLLVFVFISFFHFYFLTPSSYSKFRFAARQGRLPLTVRPQWLGCGNALITTWHSSRRSAAGAARRPRVCRRAGTGGAAVVSASPPRISFPTGRPQQCCCRAMAHALPSDSV